MTSSTYSLLTIITDIGDGASLLAVIAAASIYLLSCKSGRAALFLLTSYLVAAILIGALKLAFLDCHGYFHTPGIHSPSGHAATSAAVFWAFAILMRSHLEARRRLLPLILLTLLIAAIAVSRVLLGFHSIPEVCVGIATGLLSLLATHFILLHSRRSPVSFDAYAMALWGMGAVIAVNGTHLPSEDLLHLIAFHMKGHIPLCNTTG